MAAAAAAESSSSWSIRQKVDVLIQAFDYASALFWAEALLALDGRDARNVYTFVRCLHLAEHHFNVIDYITERRLVDVHDLFRFVMGQSLLASGRLDELLELFKGRLDAPDFQTPVDRKSMDIAVLTNLEHLDQLMISLDIRSQMNRMLGKAYCKMGDHKAAMESYKTALQCDAFVADAANALFVGHSLTVNEKQDVLQWFNSVLDNSQAPPPRLDIVKNFYTLINASTSDQIENLPMFAELAPCPMLLFKRIECLYYLGRFDEALELSERATDAGNMGIQFYALKACILHGLDNATGLFNLAKALTLKAPFSVVTLFVVGCYYSVEQNYDLAKQFFMKTSKMEPNFGYDWVAHGHACASDMEHDQAIQCYSKAASILPGHPIPLACTGVEYMVTMQFDQAKRQFTSALDLQQDNVYTLHEMGVSLLKTGKLKLAEDYFLRTMRLVGGSGGGGGTQRLPVYWEPLHCNLGTCYRKLRNYDKALEQYKLALDLTPRNPSTLICMAFVYVLQEDYQTAIDALHVARRLKPEDCVAEQLFNRAVDKLYMLNSREVLSATVPNEQETTETEDSIEPATVLAMYD